MPTREEVEQKVQESLLLFIDFLYAVVFGLIISETAKKVAVSGSTTKDWVGTFTHVTGITMVFYFLTWDWVHARILTIRNPYKGYTRFFTEIGIAFCAYSMASQILEKELSFLLYTAAILLLGVWWAQKTLRDYPGSEDRSELKTIQKLQSLVGVVVVIGFIFLRLVLHLTTINSVTMLSVVALGWLFLVFYEMRIPRVPGISSGPGVFLLSRRDVKKIRERLSRGKRRFYPKKGD
ncbi:MAG: hypothetical protein HYT48_03385 [Candidatus Vogelbacteria bacterium]|nr:hypothetical protein [Candidatus Vogelbacteria bacterium]